MSTDDIETQKDPSPLQSEGDVPGVNRPLLKLSGVGKSYRVGDHDLSVLRGVSLAVEEAETCAIVGPSGSGKTTLLGLCAGLDDPTEGEVELVGERLRDLNQDDRADLRSRSVGFVFQNFQLIPTLTALENVLVPLELRGERSGKAQAIELLNRVGLGHRVDHYPTQLSGGEQQRVALARAFIHRPRILFADEPTGNLDEETSKPIVEMLFELNREQNTALVLVTHDPQLAALAGRVISMRGGSVVQDEKPA
ncbi:ABC transporter ATP-binding protein [Puniceicoccus vermicola]|uniref:ABC transporter ATP-binding protein n=1 Tax=Puniceicoccus vermicola TaxID=388746 RepID=A0A7X1AZJ6_9BACT|nr:ABC transporter ATP-binding protein [Puniceicoccus vermicola]MBC2602866.1 ABC transporter ATP-binding protein [Puniceicoccus vermicola]